MHARIDPTNQSNAEQQARAFREAGGRSIVIGASEVSVGVSVLSVVVRRLSGEWGGWSLTHPPPQAKQASSHLPTHSRMDWLIGWLIDRTRGMGRSHADAVGVGREGKGGRLIRLGAAL